MHRRSVAVFDRFLSALSAILDKAEAHCTARRIAPEVILAARLFPDMFSFTRQVQLACDFAARGTARLAGQEPKSFPDTETSFAELRDRIAAARGYMGSFQPADFAHAETRGLAGVVTLEDVFEEMLGSEIMDESDSVADLRQMARQRRQALRAAGLLEQQKKEEQAEQSRS